MLIITHRTSEKSVKNTSLPRGGLCVVSTTPFPLLSILNSFGTWMQVIDEFASKK